ncbi:hypothetical protein ACFOYU_12595 [Microvirga sp. GCM10011540]|uniref:hypothetical protein n=1 Tax=Microvirga sp. GCM10011540 TaxID=3317338 RepID=UPI0036227F03
MKVKNRAELVGDKLALISYVLTRVEQGGGSADLHDLEQHLVDTVSLFQRNPGIEAAANDLYAAAAIHVADYAARSQPVARKLRLLREAHLRFSDRLTASAGASVARDRRPEPAAPHLKVA